MMAHITARYEEVEKGFSELVRQKDDFKQSLITLYREVALFYVKASCYFARKTFVRFLEGIITADAWTAALAGVQKADENCHKFAIGNTLGAVFKNTNETLKSLKRIESTAYMDRIKSWLISDVDVQKQHADASEKLGSQFRESGKWLIEDTLSFKTWYEGSQGQFWIKGPVGTGKTSLVSIIIDRFRQARRPNLAFYYCAYDNALNPSSERPFSHAKIFRAIIGQLALLPGDDTYGAPARIAEEVEIAFDSAVALSGLQNPPPLGRDEAIKLLVNLVRSLDETTIILDALDECQKYIEFLSLLRDLNDPIGTENLRFLFSSQYVVPVESYFPKSQKAVAGGKESIPDMISFVAGWLQNFKRSWSGTMDESLSNDMINTLSNRAEGMHACNSLVF
jgi:hypothetical protein